MCVGQKAVEDGAQGNSDFSGCGEAADVSEIWLRAFGTYKVSKRMFTISVCSTMSNFSPRAASILHINDRPHSCGTLSCVLICCSISWMNSCVGSGKDWKRRINFMNRSLASVHSHHSGIWPNIAPPLVMVLNVYIHLLQSCLCLMYPNDDPKIRSKVRSNDQKKDQYERSTISPCEFRICWTNSSALACISGWKTGEQPVMFLTKAALRRLFFATSCVVKTVSRGQPR
jgi:hypothetical protein